MEKMIDRVTGAELHPGNPELCQGNGKHEGFECCCDECDYLMLCYPEWAQHLQNIANGNVELQEHELME